MLFIFSDLGSILDTFLGAENKNTPGDAYRDKFLDLVIEHLD